MAKPTADRNLLFGVIALQCDFIGRDDLIEAMNSWVLDKSKPLGEILCAQGKLTSERLQLLTALVQEHLKRHGDDLEKTLRALRPLESVRADLASLRDHEVDASLAHVPMPESSRGLQDTVAPGDRAAGGPPSSQSATIGDPASASTRFQILRPHARGGLGQVSVALDKELNREVALKELQDRHADDPHSQARFTLEAEITGGLEHPGIVPVYGLGRYPDGRPYYAMRFIRGQSLKETIERFHQRDSETVAVRANSENGGSGPVSGWRDPGERTLELRKLLQSFIDVCQVIEYAHSRGVLHRDLKPGNIMLGKYGETQVVDWGLAKPLQHTEHVAKTMDEATLNPSSGSGVAPTQMGSAIGTPAFMSPEQAAGRLELLGPASDVYSLGATLYCLLSGKAPFSETDVPTTLRKVQRGDFLPPRQVKRDIPAELESICLRAMAHNASDRYPTPSSLATDVERWLGDEPVQAHVDSAWAQGRRWLRRHPTLATSSAITALLGIASLAVVSVVVSAKNHDLVSAYASERAARNEANVKRIEAEELRERERLAKELSNTHRDLAERLALESRQRLKRLAIATAENMLDRGDNAQALLWALRAWELDRDDQSDAAHRVRLGAIVQSLPAIEAAVFHAERVIDFVFSPDGSRVASRTDGPNVYVWNYRHSQMAFEPLRHGALVRCVTYSRDGRWLATATGEPAARIWNAQTGARATELVHPQGARWVAFTPDSTRVATCGADKQVRFWNVATGVEETGGWSTEYEGEFLAFSGDGTQLVVCERNERATLWSVADQKRVGDPLQQSLMTPSELDAYYRWPSFSPDGRRLATGTHEGAFIWDTATGREVRAYREPASNPSLRVVHELYFGPDSNELLVMRGNSLSSVLDVGSGEVTGLSHPREAARGCISPDGSRIATQSTGGLIHLWDRSDGKLIWNARCGDQATRLAFSSDGKLLGVASWDGTVRFYNTEPVKTGRAWELNCGVAHRAAVIDQEGVHRFSPDGTIEVVYKKSPVGEVRRRGGGALFRIGDPAGMPIETATFSEDGRRLIELCGDADSHLVRVWDVATQRLIASIGPTHPNRSFTSTWISVDAAASRIAARDSHGILGVFDLARQRYVLGPVENKPLTVGTFHHYHPDLIDNLAISRDGSLVAASTASDGSIAFWDVDESLIVAHQIVHRGWANSLHFSPDGTKLLLCSSDTIARIISTRTGHQVGPSLRHHGFVRHGDWHADGRRILTLSSKGDLLVWDSVTGEALMRLPGMNVSRRAWFSAARDSIVCHPSESANYVEIEIPSVTLSIDRARDVSALLTGQSIDEYDGIGFIEPTLFRSHADRFRDAFVAFRNREAL